MTSMAKFLRASGFIRMAAAAFLALQLVGCEPALTAPVLTPEDPSFNVATDGEATWTFTTIAVPGAIRTNAAGVNARGDVVGTFWDTRNVAHGYRLNGYDVSNGEAVAVDTIDFPGTADARVAYTDARGIGPNGDIVGTYRYVGEHPRNFHGFKLTRSGEYIQVDYPDHISTMSQRILPDGTILGCRHDGDMMDSMRGIVIRRSSHDETSAFASMHNGATPDLRRIAGLYRNMLLERGEAYLIDDGVFKPFVIEGSGFTAAWDVSPAGDVVGVYVDAAGSRRGFVLDGDVVASPPPDMKPTTDEVGVDEYVSIAVPDAAVTQAFGINARGDVVGAFIANGVTSGFLARRNR